MMKPLNTSEQILEDAIFSVGKVVSVKGRTVEVRVPKRKNSSNLVYRGQVLRNVSVGGYVKIAKGFTTIIGKVEGELVVEDKQFAKRQAYASDREKVDRVLTVSLLGFLEGLKFERGIKELPLIDNECFLLHRHEFEAIHRFVGDGEDAITVGNLSFEKSQDIRLGVNGLFASHIGIFGNTGSGKSYTLAKLYRELLSKYHGEQKFQENARFFLIDFNGEYADGSDDDQIIVGAPAKKTYCLSTRTPAGNDKFPISIDVLNDADFWVVFLQATEKVQTPFLRRAVNNAFVAPKVRDEGELKGLIAKILLAATTTGDRNIEKSLAVNILSELRDAFGQNESLASLMSDLRYRLKYHSVNNKFYYQPDNGAPIYSDANEFRTEIIDAKVEDLDLPVETLAEIDAIRIQILVQYFDDITRGFSNKEHLAPLIKRLDTRLDNLRKVIEVTEDGDGLSEILTVVSLRDVNLDIRKILPMLLCKKLYNDKKKENNEKKYLNIIVDEAHNILSESSDRESEQWKDYRLETFEEIIKEGRKFGVFLTIASQRPSDISPTIISQLHHYFLHRLINNEDITAVKQTISYLDRVSFEYLPLLPTGTCVLAGLIANVPIILDVAKIVPERHEPKNKTMKVVENWR